MPRVKSSAAAPETVTVPAADDMDDETFFKHYNARHLPDVGVVQPMHYHQTLSASLINTYRAFHKRCHNEKEYAHVHLDGEW